MSRLRTLPIAIAPLPGESLDSWLEALAAHTHTHYGDLLAAVDLLPSSHGTAENRWTVHLSSEEIHALAKATRTDPEQIAEMTLSCYDGIAVSLTKRAQVDRATMWGRPHGSRYCPDCLRETGGRWLLRWRLGWSFACARHTRLLADDCPTCRRVCRDRPHPIARIPRPGHCARAFTGNAGGTTCGTDLSVTATDTFDPSNPVVAAQQLLDAMIDTNRATFGIYRDDPQPAANVLDDIRCLAHQLQRLDHVRRAWSLSTDAVLRCVSPENYWSTQQ